MTNRCILIFPDFENMGVIEGIRRKYDPLAGLVRPHITLVFPFESDIGTVELRRHVESALRDFPPFRLSLLGFTEQKGFDNYLLLNVHDGKKTVKEMHRRLYTGPLEAFMPSWGRSFEPHMTVGKLADAALFAQAMKETRTVCERFETRVDEIATEIIGEGGGSTIEFTVKLTADRPLPIP